MNLFLRLRAFLVLFSVLSTQALIAQVKTPNKQEIFDSMKKVADWELANLWTENKFQPKHGPLNWTNAALYTGIAKWAAIADDSKYYDFLKKVGDDNDWKLKQVYHADDHAVAQMYLDLYRKYKDDKMLKPVVKLLDYIIYHPAKTALNWGSPYHQDRWNWCDALFMSPPVWAKLYRITGEKKYLDFMFSEYKATTNFLFDKSEDLYFRDESFFDKRDNGTKVFWARGNGWVFAGLANILQELEPGTPEYKYFVGIYKKMAYRLKELQTPEGYWAMSLLGQKYYPTPETSGTGFFTFGFAWGINNNILDKKEFEPVMWKGWNALQRCVTAEGLLGYVQPIGAAPGQAWPDKSEGYGAGAYLSAGSEIYRMVK